jgi:hypothetical protein
MNDVSDKQAAIEMDVEMRKIERAIERIERAGLCRPRS